MDAETRAYLDGLKADMDRRFGSVDEAIRALAIGTAQRFDAVDRKIDDLTSLVQSLATGTAARFDAIEQRLDGIERRTGIRPPAARVTT